MKRLMFIHVACGLGLAAAPMATNARAQILQPAMASLPPRAPSNASASSPTPAQAPPTAPASSRVERGFDTMPTLFEPTWRQAQIGGRFTSIDGDPARFQRYQDLRDGVLLTDTKFARDAADGTWLFRATADNVGYRDQRYTARYQRTGRFVLSGFWDEIPQFYSVDTKTPYTEAGGDLVLDDATQLAVQNGQANLNAYVPIAPQFDLKERRDIGHIDFVATPTPQLDVKAAFTSTQHVGELPWGASFGFSNDVEVALPYDSKTNDFTLGSEWTNGKQMFRVAYTGSWFENQDDPLVWDSPLDLRDAVSEPGRGRMSLWPSNSAQTVSAGGFAKFAHRTQLTGFISYGIWSNDEALQPFTINSALPQLALPRANSDAEARVFSTNLNFVSRPKRDWSFASRLRIYDYENNTPATSIPDFINYDAAVTDSSTGGPRLHAHDRTTFDADATWTGMAPLALTIGYTRNNTGYAVRTFDSTGEDVLRLTADAVSSNWVTFRAQYELGGRSGSGLDENMLLQIGEQPALRYYDLANRTRNRFTGIVDIMPNDVWVISASGGVGKDDYDDSYFGLQESTFRTFSLAADAQLPSGLGVGASYNFERYGGFQTSRSASPGQETDPLRDWTTDSVERVNYFSIYATPPRFGKNTEVRLSYDFSYAEGNYVYGIVPGGPLTPPSQLPEVYNKLQQLHIDARHRLSNQFALSVSYLYEPFRVYDFAFDPSVVNGIVQPSSLVLGYVYRPYTAHSAQVGLKYLF